jgi:hypothetical protein
MAVWATSVARAAAQVQESIPSATPDAANIRSSDVTCKSSSKSNSSENRIPSEVMAAAAAAVGWCGVALGDKEVEVRDGEGEVALTPALPMPRSWGGGGGHALGGGGHVEPLSDDESSSSHGVM